MRVRNQNANINIKVRAIEQIFIFNPANTPSLHRGFISILVSYNLTLKNCIILIRNLREEKALFLNVFLPENKLKDTPFSKGYSR